MTDVTRVVGDYTGVAEGVVMHVSFLTSTLVFAWKLITREVRETKKSLDKEMRK